MLPVDRAGLRWPRFFLERVGAGTALLEATVRRGRADRPLETLLQAARAEPRFDSSLHGAHPNPNTPLKSTGARNTTSPGGLVSVAREGCLPPSPRPWLLREALSDCLALGGSRSIARCTRRLPRAEDTLRAVATRYPPSLHSVLASTFHTPSGESTLGASGRSLAATRRGSAAAQRAQDKTYKTCVKCGRTVALWLAMLRERADDQPEVERVQAECEGGEKGGERGHGHTSQTIQTTPITSPQQATAAPATTAHHSRTVGRLTACRPL